jgi:putative permease
MNQSDPALDDRTPLTYRGARRIVGLIVLLIIGWLILSSLQSVLLLFAIVFLLAMVLNPVVVWLQRRGVRRLVSVVLLLIGLVVLIAILAVFAIPPVMDQLQELIRRAPDVWHKIRMRLDLLAQRYPSLAATLPTADEIADTIGNQAGSVASVLLKSTIGLVGGVFSILFALLLFVFVLADPQPLVWAYLALAPDRYREQARRTLARLMQQMTAWARGVVINGAITGISTGTLLWIVGVQPALVFGALAFLGEFIPNIGPVLVAFPVLFVALSLGATKFWLAFAAILFVQQIETNLLVPFVLGKEMRLHPVSILFFTLATASLFGLAGAILAVPAAALVQILLDEFYLRPRKLDYTAIEREAADLVKGKY